MATTISISRRTIKVKNRVKRSKPAMTTVTTARATNDAADAVVVAPSLAAMRPNSLPEPLPWWRSPWAILGLFAVIIGGLVLAAVFGAGRLSGRGDDDVVARAGQHRGTSAKTPRRGLPPNAEVTNAGAREGVTLAYDQRPLPDEQSFLATPYARRGGGGEPRESAPLVLPENASGRCVVSGNGIEALQACLQRQAGR